MRAPTFTASSPDPRRRDDRAAGWPADRAARPPGGIPAVLAAAAAALLQACGAPPGAASGQVSAEAPASAIDTRPVPADRQPLGLPEHWDRGVFMEIFVRAYQDSDGDGHGDLRGLISRLDHLQDLGVRGLWLMPITANADGDHGYATTDYRAIDPRYGTLADFDELVREARRRGIGIVMDYVINHAAAEHPMFRLARQGPGAPFRDWFVWSETKPMGWDIWGVDPWYHTASQPWTWRGDLKQLPRPGADARGFYFGTFGPHMPDFDFRQPAVRAFHEDSLRFWLNRGLAGYRLDAVPHLVEGSARDWNDQPESRRITRGLADLIRSYPQRMVVCEATAQPRAWGDPEVCGGAFAFGYVHHFLDAARGKASAVAELARFYRETPATMATFLSSHDLFAGHRPWDQLRGDEQAYRLAAAAYLLQPGTPYLYYGEEVGQAGLPGLRGDEPVRGPMSWTADPRTGGFTRGTPFRAVAPNVATHNVQAQRQDPGSLLNHYKTLIALRNGRASIARGSFEQSFAQDLLLGFVRRLGEERTWVLINFGSTPQTVARPPLPAGTGWRALYPREAEPPAADGPLVVPPRSLRVWAMDR